MTKAKISKTQTGHWLATFATNSLDGWKTTGTRIIGGPSDDLRTVYNHLQINFDVDQIGVKTKTRTMWLKPLRNFWARKPI
jgi:hypothetical protein